MTGSVEGTGIYSDLIKDAIKNQYLIFFPPVGLPMKVYLYFSKLVFQLGNSWAMGYSR